MTGRRTEARRDDTHIRRRAGRVVPNDCETIGVRRVEGLNIASEAHGHVLGAGKPGSGCQVVACPDVETSLVPTTIHGRWIDVSEEVRM